MKKYYIVLATLLFGSVAFSQSVELYAGDKRFGSDVMWFKNFKNHQQENTPFLFFSRNRASSDYDNKLGSFGSTNAVSYNFKNGLGIVAVGSFLNSGFTPKAGIQFVKMKGDFMFFGWSVIDLKSNPNVDVFGLFRYQTKLSEQWNLFSQAELFPIYNFKNESWNITERLRLGVKKNKTAFGLMMDFNQSGITTFKTTENTGAFVRYEF